MEDNTLIHRIILKKAGGAKTACGLNVIAFYPMSRQAMTDEAGKSTIAVRLDSVGITCKACKEKKGVEE